jgi:fibronectin type 3 domain-containing protein
MERLIRLCAGRKRLFFLIVLTVSALLSPRASAQAPPVPSVFQDLYSELVTYMTNFNATLNVGSGVRYTGISAPDLKNANSNVGPQLLNPTAFQGVQLQVQEIKAMGANAVLIEIGFPMLYEPFLTSQGQSYAQWAAFYQQVASTVRAAGLKLLIENDTLLTTDMQAGWNMAPFYATLNWTQYMEARAQGAVTLAQLMQPDYMVLVEEPNTEAGNSGQTEVNTPSGSLALVSTILTAVKEAGVPDMLVGAGTSTAQQNFLQYIQGYVTLPLDFIDMHIYPINRSYLPNAQQIAATAAAAGKPVAMSECWLWKVRDTELSVLTPDQVRGRDPYNFWAPLDAQFLQTMQNLAVSTKMLFMSPDNSQDFAAYLPYDTDTENLSPSAIIAQETTQAGQNLQAAMYTSTALSYYSSLVSPADTTPPTVPGGLTGQSGNPTTAMVNWSPSTDNVGVAGYHLLRNGVVVATTANLTLQDTGLTDDGTYTYTAEAFDLGGNVSAASLPIHVTTANTIPPTVPGNVVATASAGNKVGVAWAAATDKVAVSYYLLFSGSSPAALTQAARTPSTVTAYTVTPLTPGSTYYFAVQAVDTSGNTSPMSAIASVTTPAPPAAPKSVSATASSTSKVSVTWSASAAGGLPIQNYHVYRGSSASNLSQVAVVLSTSYSDTNVTAGTTYYYAVEAADTGSDVSAMSSTAEATVPSAPSAPSHLLATPISTTKIGLSWSASTGGLPIQYYQVFRGSSSSNMSQVANVNQTAYTDASGSPSTTYYYAVQATDSAGDVSPMSTTASAATLAPPAPPTAPSHLIATAISKTQINLVWTPGSSSLPLASYIIYRGTSSSSLTLLQTIGATNAAFADYTVAAGLTYYYAVQAKDTGGNLSPMSTTGSVTTP